MDEVVEDVDVVVEDTGKRVVEAAAVVVVDVVVEPTVKFAYR